MNLSGGLLVPCRRAISRHRSWRAAAILAVAAALLSLPGPTVAQTNPAPAADGSLRSWHFAEGNSRNEFNTYFAFLNISDQPASVMATYHRDDGIRLTQWFGIQPRARLSFNANETIGQRAFGASFVSDQDVIVERSTTWGPDQHAETTLGFAPNGKRGWHFAEGTTRGLVTTYFVTQNLTDSVVNVTATFTPDNGAKVKRSVGLQPRAREAYRVNDLLKDTAFAASFDADGDIVVERTIINEGQIGILGGAGSLPMKGEVGFKVWQFAEGSTRRPYLTYFVLFNPNAESTGITFRFSTDNGSSRQHSIKLSGMSRVAFDPRDVMPGADFGTTITSERPIIAERSYYSTGDSLYGALGYTPVQSRENSQAWYFAEGNTTGKIETFFIVYNLSNQSTEVQSRYFMEGGRTEERKFGLGANARVSLRANDVVPDQTFAARFTANQNILVERTFYFPSWSGFTVVGQGMGR